MDSLGETLAQSRLFAATKPTVHEAEATERKSGAARLLEIKQMLFELQEQVDEEKAIHADKVLYRDSQLALYRPLLSIQCYMHQCFLR